MDQEIDWKELCMRVIYGVGLAEGCLFAACWPMAEEQRQLVLGEYDKWCAEFGKEDPK